MNLKLITPEKVIFEGETSYIALPGIMGNFGVMHGHESFISAIKSGMVGITLKNGENRQIKIAGGIAEVTTEKCLLLADSAIAE